jgi:hypothetical protein
MVGLPPPPLLLLLLLMMMTERKRWLLTYSPGVFQNVRMRIAFDSRAKLQDSARSPTFWN